MLDGRATTVGGGEAMEYEEGDYFGDAALLKNEPHPTTIIADEDCSCVSIPYQTFKRLVGPLHLLI